MKEHKGQQIFKKGTLELQKDKKKQLDTPAQMCFLNFPDQMKFLQFFESGDA